MLKYKGYFGVVSFDADEMIFNGEVSGINDVITFRGSTAEEIKREFELSIDAYLEWCKELGEDPEKPYSGNIHLRMNPELHARLAAQAKNKGMSLNSYINEKLQG